MFTPTLAAFRKSHHKFIRNDKRTQRLHTPPPIQTKPTIRLT